MCKAEGKELCRWASGNGLDAPRKTSLTTMSQGAAMDNVKWGGRLSAGRAKLGAPMSHSEPPASSSVSQGTWLWIPKTVTWKLCQSATELSPTYPDITGNLRRELPVLCLDPLCLCFQQPRSCSWKKLHFLRLVSLGWLLSF